MILSYKQGNFYKYSSKTSNIQKYNSYSFPQNTKSPSATTCFVNVNFLQLTNMYKQVADRAASQYTLNSEKLSLISKSPQPQPKFSCQKQLRCKKFRIGNYDFAIVCFYAVATPLRLRSFDPSLIKITNSAKKPVSITTINVLFALMVVIVLINETYLASTPGSKNSGLQ